MEELNVPVSLLSPELTFNLELDTENRMNKLTQDLKLPEFKMEYPKQYVPNYQPKLDYANNKVENGINPYEGLLSDNPEIAIKARQIIDEYYNKDKFISSDFNTPILTPTSQTKRYKDQDQGYQINSDNEDYYHSRYWDQKGFFNKAITGGYNTLGRVATGAVLKFGEGLGYLGSMFLNIGQDGYWSKVADNGFSKSLEEAEDWTKEELFRVYKSANYDNKGFFSKMGDATFWQDSFADGAAFLVSAFIPGGIFSKVGSLGKLGRLGTLARMSEAEVGLVNAESWFAKTVAKVASKSGDASKIARNTNNAIEMLTGARTGSGVANYAYSIGSEAAFEAADTFKQIKSQLISQGYSEEEANKIAGEKASQTYLFNVGILGFSNAFENRLIQKVLNKKGTNAFIAHGDDLSVSSDVTKKLDMLADNTWGGKFKLYGKAYGKTAIKGFVAEGLWEENAQLAAQRIAQGDYETREVGTGTIKREKSGNFFEQILKNIKGAALGTDIEAQESIGTGALIGILGGVGTSIFTSEVGKEKESFIKSANEMIQARDNWLSNDIYEFEEDGKTLKLDANKKPIISTSKVAERDKQLALMTSQLNLAKNTTNPDLRSVVEASSFSKFALAHIKNGSIDFLIDRLNNWATQDAETLAAFGFSQELQSDINPKEYAKLAKDLKDIHSKIEENQYVAPKGMTVDEALPIIGIIKSNLFKLISENHSLQGLLDNGFQALSDPKFKDLIAIEANIKGIVESLEIAQDEGSKKYIKDQLKSLEKEVLKKQKQDKVLIDEYSILSSQKQEIQQRVDANKKLIGKLSDRDTSLEFARDQLKKEEEAQPKPEPEDQKPVIAIIKGVQYETLKDLDDALANKTITQEEYNTALTNNATKIEEKSYTVIKNKDGKYQVQFGDTVLSSVFETEAIAENMAKRFTIKNDKYTSDISGLNNDQVDELKSLERELNKIVTPPKKEKTKKKEAPKEGFGTIIEDEGISQEYIDVYKHILTLKSLKSISPDYKKKIEEVFEGTDTDTSDLKELKETAKKILGYYNIILPETGVDNTLKDLEDITDINVLNNYLKTLDQSFKDLYSKEIQAKIDILSQDEADNLTMEEQIAEIEKKMEETINSLKEGDNGGKTWIYTGQFNDQMTKFAIYEVFQSEYSKEEIIREINAKYYAELADLKGNIITPQQKQKQIADIERRRQEISEEGLQELNQGNQTDSEIESQPIGVFKSIWGYLRGKYGGSIGHLIALVATPSNYLLDLNQVLSGVKISKIGNAYSTFINELEKQTNLLNDKLEERVNKGIRENYPQSSMDRLTKERNEKIAKNNEILQKAKELNAKYDAELVELEAATPTNTVTNDNIQKEIEDAKARIKVIEEVLIPNIIKKLNNDNQSELKELYKQLRETKDEDLKKSIGNSIDKIEKRELTKRDIQELELQKEALEGQIESAKEFIVKKELELKNLNNEGAQTGDTETSTGTGQVLTGTKTDNNTGNTGTETSAGENENLDFYEDTEGNESLEEMIIRDFPDLLEIGSIDDYIEYRNLYDSKEPNGSEQDMNDFSDYMTAISEEDLEDLDFTEEDYDIATLSLDEFLSLAYETPLKTTGQTVDKKDGEDVVSIENGFTIRVLSSNEYDRQIDNLIQQLSISNSAISNALNNKESGLTLVLTKDREEWFKERGIEKGTEPGVVMVIKSKDNLKGDPETFDSLGIETTVKGPIIFTVNENAFGGISDTAFKERVIIKAEKEEISQIKAEELLREDYKKLTEARAKVMGGQEVLVDMVSATSGLYSYNKEVRNKKVVPVSYLLSSLVPIKTFDVFVNRTDDPKYAGRPTILIKDEVNEMPVGTPLVSRAMLPNEQTVLSYIQDQLGKPHETLEEARKTLSNILLLVYTKDATFSIQKDNSVEVLNLKGIKMSEKEVDTLFSKMHLRIDATKTKKGSITLEGKKYNYPDFIKNNLRITVLPVKMGNKLVFRGVNSYINFFINENNTTFTKNESMEEKILKTKNTRNTRNSRVKTDLTKLGQKTNKPNNPSSIKSEEIINTECNNG